MTTIAIAALVLSAPAPASAGQASPAAGLELKVPLAKVAESLTYYLRGSTLAALPDARQGCCLRFQVGSESDPFEFAVPDKRIDLGYAGAIVYRLANIQMNGCTVVERAGELVVLADLQSTGPTLKGRHTRLGDRAVPDVRLRNMQLAIRLKPAVTKSGRPTYVDPRAALRADVSSSLGVLQFGSQRIDLVDAISGYRSRIRTGVEAEVTKAMRSEGVRTAIERHIWTSMQKVAAQFSSRVTGVSLSGSNLVLSLEREAARQ